MIEEKCSDAEEKNFDYRSNLARLPEQFGAVVEAIFSDAGAIWRGVGSYFLRHRSNFLGFRSRRAQKSEKCARMPEKFSPVPEQKGTAFLGFSVLKLSPRILKFPQTEGEQQHKQKTKSKPSRHQNTKANLRKIRDTTRKSRVSSPAI